MAKPVLCSLGYLLFIREQLAAGRINCMVKYPTVHEHAG
jgi:hypothetical protein